MMTASVTVECDGRDGDCEAKFHIDDIPGEECHAIVQRTFRLASRRGWVRSYDQRGRPRFRCPLHTREAENERGGSDG